MDVIHREVLRLLEAAVHSARGWRILLREEANARYLLVLVFATVGMRMAGWIGHASFMGAIVAIGTATAVEITNTAMERTLDVIEPGHSEHVRRIKDIMSAAVSFTLLIYLAVMMAGIIQ